MYDIINYIDCTDSQLADIFILRNLPEIRKWMTNPEPISWDEHIRFIEILRHENERRYYAIYKNGDLVATYNLTKESGTTWERGIISSPKFQGSGSTVELERIVFSKLPVDEFTIILAKVKLENGRSIRYHEKVGYQEINRDKEYIYYQYKLNMVKKFYSGGGKNLTSQYGITQMAAVIMYACLQNRMMLCR